MNVFTVLWPADYCRTIEKKTNWVGKPLPMLWGGHNRQTDYRFYGVAPGDVLVPVWGDRGGLYAVASLKVRRIVRPEAHLLFFPEHAPLLEHTCANQVIEGEEATDVRFDRVLPPEMLESLRYGSGKKERAIKGVQEGKLTSTTSIQGVYCLTDASGCELLNFIRSFN